MTFKKTMDGNEAAAYVAHKVSDVCAIYPITPSSPMGEWADQWSAQGKTNIWGAIPQVIEMQSEGGASGTLHGALQTGALATTFTASQGLLLMIPNMYKIAGELTPCVIHVAARSLACQALSIFGDHSDVMAARSSGFAMLCSNNVQEAHDLSLIAHTVTLESRIPFMHFFEGFRTSHEANKINIINDETIRSMIDDDLVIAHRDRALNPEKPAIRGTAQNPDVYFQGRETVNGFYDKVPAIVEKAMDKFAKLTGRTYNLVEYYGDNNADRVIVVMGSGADIAKEAINALNAQGEKLGVLAIHLYRPFPVDAFMRALPKSAKSIAVLDRTKEPGAVGEPLYQDVIATITQYFNDKKITNIPYIIGGRYGLSSKEFTPAMAKGVFDELKKSNPKKFFTIGIEDDVTHLSLDFDPTFITESDDNVRAMFFGLGSDGTIGANKNSIKIIGQETDLYTQGYFVYDSKKAGSRTVSHLRFGPKPIHSPYLIESANFIGVHQFNFLYQTYVLKHAAVGSTLLLNSTYSKDEVWKHIPRVIQQTIIDKKIKFYVIDAYKVAQATGMGWRINTIMQTCFFELANVLPPKLAIEKIKHAIKKTYSRKGEDIVRQNYEAVDQALAHLYQVDVPKTTGNMELPPIVIDNAPKFVKEVTAQLMIDEGDNIKVSQMPIDGTFPTGTTKFEKRNIAQDTANWDKDLCIQCGKCAIVCPHGVIRSKRYDASQLKDAPASFKHAPAKGCKEPNKEHTLEVYIEDCTGCGTCYEACPVKSKDNPDHRAINILPKEPIFADTKKNIGFFEKIAADEILPTPLTMKNLQYAEPLFEFSGACAGCGETAYVTTLSRLFGNRMVIANATGCSSIYGGNLPTTPWTVDKNGRGPVWSNSLFEDNAEFGYGFRVSEDQLTLIAEQLLLELAPKIGQELVDDIILHVTDNTDETIAAQHKRIAALKDKLATIDDSRAKHLISVADHLAKRSIWIIGGDGWAYDIGFGGLDHVLSCGRNVNVFVMNTEVYSNTGGQSSKATPMGAIAKFAFGGKPTPKKDLGLMAMSYGYVYVTAIALGSNPMQALKAIKEAESYDGPSLIIAYSHCISHGIKDMRYGLEQQNLAVKSGHWPLYRYNPTLADEGKNPFILDSKEPSVDLKDYMYNENRFLNLTKTNPEMAQELLKEAQENAKKRWQLYKKMAG